MQNEKFDLRLDPLDVQMIAEDAMRQDYYDRMEHDITRLYQELHRTTGERDTAVDQRNWAWMIALVACGAHVARFVWAAVRG